MNFFQHQRQARRRSLIYLSLFAAAAAAVVAMTDVIVLGVYYAFDDAHRLLPFGAWLRLNPAVIGWTTLLVFGAIAGASVYRMASLAGGGARVAQELRGTRVPTSSADPSERVLLNVVEEMAIAAGVPVPDVYVLRDEDGINAFAAGFGVGDAALVVTQGALVHLNREEMQGVIGHEFSHILNGDTRLNTQLIGVLYGIMVVGLAGRLILRATAEGGARLLVVALVPGVLLTVVGYLGLFFGRMIQAAVSRSREALADASAVQFTRDPGGLASALKKIAVAPGQGILMVDCSEVGHMLIVDGRKLFDQFFATHPPLLERIKAVDPHFDPSDLARIKLRPVAIASPARRQAPAPISPATVVANIGRPTDAQLDAAIERHAAIPDALRRAAHSDQLAPSLVLALALNRDPGEHARGVARLRERLPEALHPHLEAVAMMAAGLAPEQRLPLIALAFPALRQRPRKDLRALIAAVEEVGRMDGNYDFLDYALVRLLRMQLIEALAPQTVPTPFAAKLYAMRDEAAVVLAVVAQAGERDKYAAHAAYEAGMRPLFGANVPAYAPPDPWMAPLDRALTRLDALAPLAKESLVKSLVATILHDRRVRLGELELLRAICASLHCPLPPLAPGGAGAEDARSPHAAA